MNYFFGIKTKFLKSKLSIPRFKNDGSNQLQYFLYKCQIRNQSWVIKRVLNGNPDSNFFFVDDQLSNNENIFFFFFKSDVNFLENLNHSELANFNTFADGSRSNLQISNNSGGFSSFQSEYPYHMIGNKGSILAPLSVLANKFADKNYVFIKNIFKKPIKEKFKTYFIDIKKKRVIKHVTIYTNTTNCIEIEKTLIKPEVYLFTDNFLGVPMFVSEKNNHLSIEHTHPPHEYILSPDRFSKVKILKSKINEIIN